MSIVILAFTYTTRGFHIVKRRPGQRGVELRSEVGVGKSDPHRAGRVYTIAAGSQTGAERRIMPNSPIKKALTLLLALTIGSSLGACILHNGPIIIPSSRKKVCYQCKVLRNGWFPIENPKTCSKSIERRRRMEARYEGQASEQKNLSCECRAVARGDGI